MDVCVEGLGPNMAIVVSPFLLFFPSQSKHYIERSPFGCVGQEKELALLEFSFHQHKSVKIDSFLKTKSQINKTNLNIYVYYITTVSQCVCRTLEKKDYVSVQEGLVSSSKLPIWLFYDFGFMEGQANNGEGEHLDARVKVDHASDYL